jgi:hypothetical protein
MDKKDILVICFNEPDQNKSINTWISLTIIQYWE